MVAGDPLVERRDRQTTKTYLLGGSFKHFNIQPEPWESVPIWQAYFWDRWFNRQLDTIWVIDHHTILFQTLIFDVDFTIWHLDPSDRIHRSVRKEVLFFRLKFDLGLCSPFIRAFVAIIILCHCTIKIYQEYLSKDFVFFSPFTPIHVWHINLYTLKLTFMVN